MCKKWGISPRNDKCHGKKTDDVQIGIGIGGFAPLTRIKAMWIWFSMTSRCNAVIHQHLPAVKRGSNPQDSLVFHDAQLVGWRYAYPRAPQDHFVSCFSLFLYLIYRCVQRCSQNPGRNRKLSVLCTGLLFFPRGSELIVKKSHPHRPSLNSFVQRVSLLAGEKDWQRRPGLVMILKHWNGGSLCILH